MSFSGLDAFDKTLQETHEWLNGISDQLMFQDRRDAYSALRAVLMALRDRLTVEEAVHLGDQLPMLIRGIYYEGWSPSHNPGVERTSEEFLSNIQRNLRYDIRKDAERIAHAVFNVISKHVTEGEIKDVISQLPQEIRKVLI